MGGGNMNNKGTGAQKQPWGGGQDQIETDKYDDPGIKSLNNLIDNLSPERRALLALRLQQKEYRISNNDFEEDTLFGSTLPLKGQSELIKIQSGKDDARIPFFCVHPVGGNVFCYTALANHLGNERTFYGIPSPYITSEDALIQPNLQSIAASYIKTIQRVQQSGPYLLGGWSMGGIVAYEMALQLRAIGEEITLLSLFDARVPSADQTLIQKDESSLLINFVHDLGFTKSQINVSFDELLKLKPEEQLSCLFNEARTAGLIPANTEFRQIRRLFQTFKVNAQAMCRYVPQSYAGRVCLFKAFEQPILAASDYSMGWNSIIVEGLEIYDVPGNHYTILREPQVRVLADKLNFCLNKLD